MSQHLIPTDGIDAEALAALQSIAARLAACTCWPPPCVTCGRPLEYVPTPPAATVEWHPPTWRHRDGGTVHGMLPTRPARTDETVGGAS